MKLDGKVTKYLIEKEATCSMCDPHKEYAGCDGGSVDAWAKNHAKETGHIVSIQELHDVAVIEN